MIRSLLTAFIALFAIFFCGNLVMIYLLEGETVFWHLLQTDPWFYFVNLYISAGMSLLITAYNQWENWRLKQGFEQEITAVLKGKPLQNAQLQVLADKIILMQNRLSYLAQDDNQKQADVIKLERKRISRELHDSVSQQLFAATMILSGVSQNKTMDAGQIQEQIALVLRVLGEAQNEMRALLLQLRPIDLNGKTLIEGIQGLIAELQSKVTGEIIFDHDGSLTLSAYIEDNLFRIMQEMLSNALKHAQASQIKITLRQNANDVFLIMVDNGVGFEPTLDKMASYGLKSIKERSLLLGGDAKIKSQPEQGTKIEIRIPYDR